MRDFSNTSNIDSIEFLEEEIDMVDLGVEEAECFFANGMLVHNCQQELRLVTNMSREKVWGDAFNAGGDIHMQCYSEDTEFLTEEGFKLAKDVKDLKIAQYQDGKITFVPNGGLLWSDSEDCVSVNGHYNQLLVTSNHRMYRRTHEGCSYTISEAKNCVGKAYRLLSAGIYEGVERTEPFEFPALVVRGKCYDTAKSFTADAFIKWLGFYLGGGTASDSGRMTLAQSLSSKKAEQVVWLKELNRELGIFFYESVSAREGNMFVYERSNKLVSRFIVSISKKNGKKRIPDFVYELSLRQRLLFLDAFVRAAGSKDTREGRFSYVLYAEDLDLINDFQRLCCISGLKSKIDFVHKKHRTKSFKGREFKGESTGVYRMSISPKVESTLKAEATTFTNHSGRKYCFSVPSGLLVVRRNGTVTICGNTAKLAFGVETKEARGHAKSISFGLLYGMSTFSLAKRLGVSVQKAEEIVAKYFGALTSLKKWIFNQKQEARKRMMVYTYFGRPRDLSPYYNTSDPKKIAFGDRSAVNGPIQASGADVLRKKICEIDKYMDEHPEFKQNVTMAFSVYDEINFYVKAEYAEQACKIIPQLMYEMHDNWICPLTVELGVGTSWGSMIDNPIYKNGKIIDSPNIKWYENCKPVDA